MRNPENNRNMLPFPVVGPVYCGLAAAMRPVARSQAWATIAGEFPRDFPKKKPVHASLRRNEFDNRQGFES
ncbi:hypothetical protein D3C72_1468360 [compost metagenome]